MTGSGRRGRAGHLRRVEHDESSRSFCGRGLSCRCFDDEAVEPPVCRVCLRAVQKAWDFEHYHVAFSEGRWRLRYSSRTSMFIIVSSPCSLTSWSLKCSHPGCEVMVPQRIVPMNVTTGTGTTLTWSWRAA